MKNLISLLLCLLMVMGFAACKNGDSTDSSTPQSSIDNDDGTVKDNYDWMDNLIN